jgi:hypothetical protein
MLRRVALNMRNICGIYAVKPGYRIKKSAPKEGRIIYLKIWSLVLYNLSHFYDVILSIFELNNIRTAGQAA